MALPEQIRNQSEVAEKFYAENAVETEGVETPEQAEDTVVEAADDTLDEQAAASEHEQEDAEKGKGSENFEQKYKTLQGMYNAEVPRLHQQVREQTQRMQQMEQLLSSLSANKQEPKEEPARQQYVTEQDIEDYGDSIDVMRKVSREELTAVAQRLATIENAFNQLQSNIVPQVNTVIQQQQASSEQAFWSQLAGAVPNWRDVNSDPDFQSWLLQADQLTGLTRQTYLEDAQRALDANRVIAFFRTWLEMNGGSQAPVAQTTGSAKSELEKQVAPGRPRSAGAKASSKAKVYTLKDIEKFFEDVRKGKYKGREDERAKIERDIFSAQRENRIQIA